MSVKKINAITIGAINLPKRYPILIHILFNVDKREGLMNAINKKDIETIKDHNLIFSEKNKGHNPIIKKTMKNNIPKLLSDEDFITLDYIYINIKLYMIVIKKII